MTTTDDEWGIKPELKGKRAEWYVSHSKDGFVLNVITESSFRASVEWVADQACVLSGHRFCNSLYAKVADWADKSRETVYTTPIDRETADKLSWRVDTWSYLDD